VLILPTLLGPFQPPKPASGGPATVFPLGRVLRTCWHLAMSGGHIYILSSHTGTLYAGRILLLGLGGRKAPNSMGKISTAGVLRLRATSALSRDKSVRRSAQDDDFVGVLKKNIPNILALMGRSPGRNSKDESPVGTTGS
jgi:hypothetical protein